MSNTVTACIGADCFINARVLVANRSEMQLHGNTARMICPAKKMHQPCLLRAGEIGKADKSVVGNLSAVCAKIIEGFFQRVRQIVCAEFFA